MPGIEEIEADLKAVQSKTIAASDRLDSIVARFLQEVPAVAKDWIMAEARRQIESHPAVAKSLGTTSLGKLKARLTVYCDGLSSTAEKALGPAGTWPHRRGRVGHEPGFQGREGFLESVFREIVGGIGVIMEEYGLLKNADNWECQSNGYRPRYNITFGNPIAEICGEYTGALGDFHGLLEERSKLRKDLAVAEAVGQWEQA
jgi:hypothetical protein